MAERTTMLVPELRVNELLAYHEDTESALRLFFSPASPSYESRFFGMSTEGVASLRESRISETDIRSSLAVLTSMEAHFRADFDVRCSRRLKDPLSRHFRDLRRNSGDRVRLDEDILDGWKKEGNVSHALLQEVKSALRYRHWIAHGRYWTPKMGRKYDFTFIYLLAKGVVDTFPFEI